MIPQDFLQQLLDRTDIVAVVEQYVPLKKAGANYQARCPFHSEKSPSFTVSPTKQFYHCFGCGAHGTAISFLMEHAGIPFVEAVKDLAGRVGMEVPDDGSRRPPEEENRRERMFERMEAATSHYRKGLKGNEKVVDYLKNRGLTGETAARFGIGYAPEGWQGLREAMADYADPLLVEIGLVIVHEDKRYDRFRDRVMFPIRNERGQVIAFGGRVIGKGEPKYLNSSETPLFHKGRELYGLYEHRRAIQGENRVVVVEGYMDVVMLDQHGVQNAVATLGTAITADQAARLLRMADDVVFAFDGDNAGRKAAWRALENSLPQIQDGKRLSFLFLPEGEDPDSYVRAQGADAFRKLCDGAMPLSDFLFAELTAQTDLGSQEGQVRLAKLVEPHIDKLGQAPLLKRMLQQRLAGLTGLEPPRAPRAHRREAPAPGQPRGRAAVQLSAWQIALQAVLHDPSRATRMGEMPESERPEALALATAVALLREHPEMGRREIVDHFAGRPEHTLLIHAEAGLLAWEKSNNEEYDVEADFQGALNTLAAQAGRAQAKELSGRRPSELTPEEKARLLAALQRRKPDPI
ncbi:MAG: DNA primase [Pseudomonadota bacterium]|nr:DNA primase [Pseudomonadota bacterium]MDP1905690.1 DNA primase [Pseudomonadota bacterium]MDP2353562.1 DNA primase [Pseudomonadota bacterium]